MKTRSAGQPTRSRPFPGGHQDARTGQLERFAKQVPKPTEPQTMNSVTKLPPASRDESVPRIPSPTGPGNPTRASRERFRLAMNGENDLIALQSPATRQAVKVTLEALQHAPGIGKPENSPTGSSFTSSPDRAGNSFAASGSRAPEGTESNPHPPTDPSGIDTRNPGSTPESPSTHGTRQAPPQSQPNSNADDRSEPPAEPPETDTRQPGGTPGSPSTHGTRQTPPQSQPNSNADDRSEPPAEPPETDTRQPGGTPGSPSTHGTRQAPPQSQPNSNADDRSEPPAEPPETDTRKPGGTPGSPSTHGTRQAPPQSQPNSNADDRSEPPAEPPETDTRKPGGTSGSPSTHGTRQTPPQSQPNTSSDDRSEPPAEPPETDTRQPGGTPESPSTPGTRQAPPQSQPNTSSDDTSDSPAEPPETDTRKPGGTTTTSAPSGTGQSPGWPRSTTGANDHPDPSPDSPETNQKRTTGSVGSPVPGGARVSESKPGSDESNTLKHQQSPLQAGTESPRSVAPDHAPAFDRSEPPAEPPETDTRKPGGTPESPSTHGTRQAPPHSQPNTSSDDTGPAGGTSRNRHPEARRYNHDVCTLRNRSVPGLAKIHDRRQRSSGPVSGQPRNQSEANDRLGRFPCSWRCEGFGVETRIRRIEYAEAPAVPASGRNRVPQKRRTRPCSSVRQIRTARGTSRNRHPEARRYSRITFNPRNPPGASPVTTQYQLRRHIGSAGGTSRNRHPEYRQYFRVTFNPRNPPGASPVTTQYQLRRHIGSAGGTSRNRHPEARRYNHDVCTLRNRSVPGLAKIHDRRQRSSGPVSGQPRNQSEANDRLGRFPCSWRCEGFGVETRIRRIEYAEAPAVPASGRNRVPQKRRTRPCSSVSAHCGSGATNRNATLDEFGSESRTRPIDAHRANLEPGFAFGQILRTGVRGCRTHTGFAAEIREQRRSTHPAQEFHSGRLRDSSIPERRCDQRRIHALHRSRPAVPDESRGSLSSNSGRSPGGQPVPHRNRSLESRSDPFRKP